MIVRPRVALAGAAFVAITVHLVVAHGLAPDDQVQTEGHRGTIQAKLGSSFADMATGTLTAAEPVETLQTLAPPERTMRPIQPLETLRETSAPKPVTGAVPMQTIGANKPNVSIFAQVVPPKPEPVAATMPSAAVVAVEPDSAAPIRSIRPKPRDPKRVRVIKRKSVKRGNADQVRAQGVAAGSKTARSTAQGTSKKKGAKTGDAAADNYPGLVMRKISRALRPRGGIKGTTLVSFTISSTGALARLSVAKSSGSPELDQMALKVVRRAAPFPPPPSGAKRSFAINIKGR